LIERAGPSRSQPAHTLSAEAEAAPASAATLESSSRVGVPCDHVGQKKNDESQIQK